MAAVRKPNLRRWLEGIQALKNLKALEVFNSAKVWLYGNAVIRGLQGKPSYLYNLAVDVDFDILIESIKNHYPDAYIRAYPGELSIEFSPYEVIGFSRVISASEKRNKTSLYPSLNSLLKCVSLPAASMTVELTGRNTGKIKDSFSGYQDYLEKRIRIPEIETMQLSFEQKLTYCCLAAEFGIQQSEINYSLISQDGAETMNWGAKKGTSYLMQILAMDRPSLGLIPLYRSGLLKSIFPEAANLAGVEQIREYHHKDVFFHTCTVIDNVAAVSENVWLRFAALVHDIAKPHTKKFIEGVGWSYHGHEELGARLMKGIFRRLALPAAKLEYIQKMIRLHLRPSILANDTVTDSAIRRLATDAGGYLTELMTLCRADITSKNLSKVSKFMRNYDYVEERINEVREKDELAAFQSPVRGEDIMRICGIPPSKKVGEIKTAIEQAILSGDIANDYDAALAFLYKIKDSILAQ